MEYRYAYTHNRRMEESHPVRLSQGSRRLVAGEIKSILKHKCAYKSIGPVGWLISWSFSSSVCLAKVGKASSRLPFLVQSQFATANSSRPTSTACTCETHPCTSLVSSYICLQLANLTELRIGAQMNSNGHSIFILELGEH